MAKCIPCIGARLKEILKAQVPDKDLHKLLEKLDDCPKATQAKFCGSRVERGSAARIIRSWRIVLRARL